jgi:hypothetical protein
MQIAFALADEDCDTEVVALPDGLPKGLSAADNEVVWRRAHQGRGALRELTEWRQNMEAPLPQG